MGIGALSDGAWRRQRAGGASEGAADWRGGAMGCARRHSCVGDGAAERSTGGVGKMEIGSRNWEWRFERQWKWEFAW